MKKELSATERRLNARNDRIYQLEQLVTGQEHKLNQREQRYNEELAALKRQVTLGTFLFSVLYPRSLSLSPLITSLSPARIYAPRYADKQPTKLNKQHT
jgi:septal ring factor EnvC (AmiA/AmiB activator)